MEDGFIKTKVEIENIADCALLNYNKPSVLRIYASNIGLDAVFCHEI